MARGVYECVRTCSCCIKRVLVCLPAMPSQGSCLQCPPRAPACNALPGLLPAMPSQGSQTRVCLHVCQQRPDRTGLTLPQPTEQGLLCSLSLAVCQQPCHGTEALPHHKSHRAKGVGTRACSVSCCLLCLSCGAYAVYVSCTACYVSCGACAASCGACYVSCTVCYVSCGACAASCGACYVSCGACSASCHSTGIPSPHPRGRIPAPHKQPVRLRRPQRPRKLPPLLQLSLALLDRHSAPQAFPHHANIRRASLRLMCTWSAYGAWAALTPLVCSL